MNLLGAESCAGTVVRGEEGEEGEQSLASQGTRVRGGSSAPGRRLTVGGATGDGSRPDTLFGKVPSNVMTCGSLSRDDPSHSLSHIPPHQMNLN